MPRTAQTPVLPSAEDLAWALFQVMDGTQEHDLVAMTGLPEAECAKVFDIYRQVCNVYYPDR